MINFQLKYLNKQNVFVNDEFKDINYKNFELEKNSKEFKEKQMNYIKNYNSKIENAIKNNEISEEYLITNNIEYPKKYAVQTFDFVNYSLENSIKIENGKKIGILKFKEILIKAYPNLRQALRNGESVKKIMENYTLKCLPQFDMRKIILILR